MNKLEILNSIPVIDSESDGECLYSVYIENTEENRAKLIQIGTSEKEIEEMTDTADEIIDISMIGFTYTNAQWFQESLGGFLDYLPEHAPKWAKYEPLPQAIKATESPNEVAAVEG